MGSVSRTKGHVSGSAIQKWLITITGGYTRGWPVLGSISGGASHQSHPIVCDEERLVLAFFTLSGLYFGALKIDLYTFAFGISTV